QICIYDNQSKINAMIDFIGKIKNIQESNKQSLKQIKVVFEFRNLISKNFQSISIINILTSNLKKNCYKNKYIYPTYIPIDQRYYSPIHFVLYFVYNTIEKVNRQKQTKKKTKKCFIQLQFLEY
ncbi:hypothetical protein TTHERM_002096560, partial (macronuclear) [Tetrahymena thermophila SB210]